MENLRLGPSGFSNRPSSIRNQTINDFPGKESSGVPIFFNALNVIRNILRTTSCSTPCTTLENGPEECLAGGGTRELRVNLDFQLGAGDGDFKVISELLPKLTS
jgi:hypothetical protein